MIVDSFTDESRNGEGFLLVRLLMWECAEDSADVFFGESREVRICGEGIERVGDVVEEQGVDVVSV